ncbi:hypothetical protein [Kitasatospora sp. NPDC097643]|uniref:hypothetical protein n=1 Tax=Kitasatospora sp. NPDC097643 TaxID=3157230 RepID=UPI003316F115
MTDEHRDLAEQLVSLAESPAPPPGFDPARSVVEGRARLRRRRRAAIGAAAAATAVVVAGALLLGPGGSNAAPAPPAAPTLTATPSTTPTAAPTPTPTRAGIDPLTTEVHFGWLPDWVGGQAGVGYETGYHGIYAQARGRGQDPARILLSLQPAGSEPSMTAFGGHQKLVKEEAPQVNGREAFWAVAAEGDTPVQLTLHWLAPSGRWAELSGYGGQRSDVTREVLLKVAADVRFGHWDVPLPVQFTGLPGSFKATDVSLNKPGLSWEDHPWGMWLMFQVGQQNVSVTMEPAAQGPNPEPSPTGTDGSPYTDPNPPLCQVSNGIQLCVGAGAGVPPELEQLGGLPAMLAHTKALGVDESTWTTDVVR